MTALQTLLLKIKELDKKRTPGPWKHEWERYSAKNIIGCKPLDDRWIAHCQPEFNGEDNADFIVVLANECAKLVKIIEVQSEALKRADELFASDNMRTLVLREAIEQAEKIAEGSGK